MNPLQNFLDRFQKILTYPGQVKKPIIETIAKVARINLSEKDFDVKDGVVYLKTSPGIKNELFMRKKSILRELEVLLDKKAPRDIR